MEKLLNLFLAGIVALLSFFYGKKTESENQAKQELKDNADSLQKAKIAKEKVKKENPDEAVLSKDKYNRDNKK